MSIKRSEKKAAGKRRRATEPDFMDITRQIIDAFAVPTGRCATCGEDATGVYEIASRPDGSAHRFMAPCGHWNWAARRRTGTESRGPS